MRTRAGMQRAGHRFVLATAVAGAVATTLGPAARADSPPVLNVADARIVEGDAGRAPLLFHVRLSAPSSEPVTFSWAVRKSGTATAGTDFVASRGTTTIDPGERGAVVPVVVIPDEVAEPSERFSLVITSVSGANLGQARAYGTILDDDGKADGTPTVDIGSAEIYEGNSGVMGASLTLRLDRPLTQEVKVAWITEDISASNGFDYLGGSGFATIKAGEVWTTVTVRVRADERAEPDEAFRVHLVRAEGANLGRSLGVVTIVDDD